MNYKKLFVVLIIFISSFLITSQARAGVPIPVTGWGWSSNIGHISFNCSNTNKCANNGGVDYHVDFSTSTATLGTFSGYAWSSNVGWISFNTSDIATCPLKTEEDAGSRTPRANLSNGSVLGWARVIAGGSDGWDGCIHLSGTNHMTGVQDGSRGITFNTTANEFRGYAWGDTNVGWLTFKSSLGFPVKIPNFGGPAVPSCTLTFSVAGNIVTLGITTANTSTNRFDLYRIDTSGNETQIDSHLRSSELIDTSAPDGVYTYRVQGITGVPMCSTSNVSVGNTGGPSGPAGTLWLEGKPNKTETSLRTNQSTLVNWDLTGLTAPCNMIDPIDPTTSVTTGHNWGTIQTSAGSSPLSPLPANIYTLQINCANNKHTNSVRIIVTGSDIHED